MPEQVCEGNKVYGQRNGDAVWSWGLGYRVTSLYLFTDRCMQRWVRCSSSGARAFPDSRSLLTYFPQ